MRKYDGPDTLIYLDPPYVQETRDRRNRYRFEWETDDHEACARVAMACAGYVVISGYACNLYRDLYEDQGWTRYDRRARTNGRHRTESVWISPRTANALTAYQQGELL